MLWLLLSYNLDTSQGTDMKLEQDREEEPYTNVALDIDKKETNVR